MKKKLLFSVLITMFVGGFNLSANPPEYDENDIYLFSQDPPEESTTKDGYKVYITNGTCDLNSYVLHDGYKYIDNYKILTISKCGKEIYRKEITKAVFVPLVPESDLNKYLLGGLGFYEKKENTFLFGTGMYIPDSDIGYSFFIEITIDPNTADAHFKPYYDDTISEWD